MVTRPRFWLKTTSEKGPHLSCVVFTLRGKQAENDKELKELDAAATECRKMKCPKQALARLPHPAASSTSTSAPLAPAPLGNTPPPSPRVPDTARSRTPPPDRPRPIGMPPGPPVPAPPASPAAAQVALLRIPWAKAKTLPKTPKGMIPHGTKIHLFFTVSPQKGHDFAPKGGKKGKNKGKDKGGHKDKGKGKGKDQKG